MFTTSILLITFNRPSHTRRVLGRILEASPRDLYIFQDGAREGNASDVQKCQEVHEVIDELITQYQIPDTKHRTLNTNFALTHGVDIIYKQMPF